MSDPTGQAAWDKLTEADFLILALERGQGNPNTPLEDVLIDYLTMLEEEPEEDHPALRRAFLGHWPQYAADINRFAAAHAAMGASSGVFTPSQEAIDDLVAFGNRTFQELLKRKQNDPT